LARDFKEKAGKNKISFLAIRRFSIFRNFEISIFRQRMAASRKTRGGETIILLLFYAQEP